MRSLSFLPLAFLPISVLARSLNHYSPSRLRHNSRRNTTTSFTLRVKHQGSTFFDGWDFWSSADPTHGNVEYLNQADATAANLAYVQNDGTVTLRVDNTTPVPPGGNRKSVRISSKASYNDGLFIADFLHMPTGDSNWPAYWTCGPNWPNGGEMDIVEYVNTDTTNQYTLHTGGGSSCAFSNSVPGIFGTSKAFDGTLGNTECLSSNSNNGGCSVRDSSPNSAGVPFNAGGGGVFAHLWDTSQIAIWAFDRCSIPADITSGIPDPSKWGVPQAYISSATCDIPSHFNNHQIIIDTTICGDWAGAAYNGAGHGDTCADAVAKSSNYDDAFWTINYVAVYGAN